MSTYTLIKATSKAQRLDTIADLRRINHWLWEKGKPAISCYGKSLRALENSVALGIDKIASFDLPLERGETFYRSILPEIKVSERKKFNNLNKIG